MLTFKEPIMSSPYSTESQSDSGKPAINSLLSLFPRAKPARIRVQVGLPARAKGASENSIIMFRAHDTAIFYMNFPIHGGEAVVLRTSSSHDAMPAVVIALMHDGPGLAVAVRFMEGIPRWFLHT